MRTERDQRGATRVELRLPARLTTETGERIDSIARALKDDATQRYHQPRGFQLISAGLDGEFGTEDDVPGFQVRKD